jgi:hypothetical protein
MTTEQQELTAIEVLAQYSVMGIKQILRDAALIKSQRALKQALEAGEDFALDETTKSRIEEAIKLNKLVIE